MYRSILITERVVMLANPNKAPKKPYKSHPFKIKLKPKDYSYYVDFILKKLDLQILPH